MYYINPFNYLIGGLVNTVLWDVEVECNPEEYGVFSPPAGQTCEAYMQPFLQQNPGYLRNPQANANCEYCPYSRGDQYLQTLNLGNRSDGWRDIGITA